MSNLELQLLENELKALAPSRLSNEQIDKGLLQIFSGKLSTVSPESLSETCLTELELQITSSELLEFQPSCLDDSLMDRLAMIPLEATMSHISPAMLSGDLEGRLINILEVDEKKVIPFSVKESKRGNLFSWYATVAAVAILGLFTGFLVVNRPANSVQFVSSDVSSIPKYFQTSPIQSKLNGELLNVSTKSTLINARDEGLVPNNATKAFYRAVRVTLMEKCLIKNELGEKVEIQRPVERTILVPASTD